MMPTFEVIVIAFTVTNSLRVAAYVPQIARLSRDRSGAAAVSLCTWLLFLVSHMMTAAYAGVVLDDGWMRLAFSANAACCAAIAGLTLMKRQSRAAEIHSCVHGTQEAGSAGIGDLGLRMYRPTNATWLPDDCRCGAVYTPRRT